MNADRISSQGYSSPTLKPGRGYLSLIAQVPEPLASLVLEWKLKQGLQALSPHITVYVREMDEGVKSGWNSAGLADALRALSPVKVLIGGVKTFRPLTSVDYLAVERGTEDLQALHQVCVNELGQWATPFPYVPHITLAQNLERGQIEHAKTVFENLPVIERSFTVDALHAYSYDGEQWSPLGSIDMA